MPETFAFDIALDCGFPIRDTRPAAEVVELADTLCSGRSAFTGVGVQIPPSALNVQSPGDHTGAFLFWNYNDS